MRTTVPTATVLDGLDRQAGPLDVAVPDWPSRTWTRIGDTDREDPVDEWARYDAERKVKLLNWCVGPLRALVGHKWGDAVPWPVDMFGDPCEQGRDGRRRYDATVVAVTGMLDTHPDMLDEVDPDDPVQPFPADRWYLDGLPAPWAVRMANAWTALQPQRWTYVEGREQAFDQEWADRLARQSSPPEATAAEVRARETWHRTMIRGRLGAAGLIAPPARLRVVGDDETADPAPARVNGVTADVLTVRQLRNLPKPVPLIEGTLWRHTYGLLTGRDHSLKTFVALDWALHLATGRAWNGRPVAEPVRVLYLVGEGAFGISTRVDAWELAHGVEVPEGMFESLPRAVNMFRPAAEADRADLVEHVAAGGYGLVVVDTLRRVSGGADGNGSDMGVVVDNLDRVRLATAGGCLLVLAHTGKDDKDARGFSGIEDDADVVWHTTRNGTELRTVIALEKWKNGADGTVVTLDAEVVRWGPGEDEASLVLTENPDDSGPHGSNATENLMLAALQSGAFGPEGATSAKLIEATGRSRTSVYAGIQVLTRPGGPVVGYDGPRKLRHFRLRRPDDD